MADTRQDTSSKLAGIDLSQFYQVFFEEAGENLESMEQMLLSRPTKRSSTRSSAARTPSRAARPRSALPTWPS